MKLPLTVNEWAEVFDSDGYKVADFYCGDFGPNVCRANAEHYAAMMNRMMPVEEDGA